MVLSVAVNVLNASLHAGQMTEVSITIKLQVSSACWRGDFYLLHPGLFRPVAGLPLRAGPSRRTSRLRTARAGRGMIGALCVDDGF